MIGPPDLILPSPLDYDAAVESKTFIYLYQCYERFLFHSSNTKVIVREKSATAKACHIMSGLWT